MIKTIANHLNNVAELIADEQSDVTNLTKFDVGAGSTCIVIETKKVLMLGNDGIWHEI